MRPWLVRLGYSELRRCRAVRKSIHVEEVWDVIFADLDIECVSVDDGLTAS